MAMFSKPQWVMQWVSTSPYDIYIYMSILAGQSDISKPHVLEPSLARSGVPKVIRLGMKSRISSIQWWLNLNDGLMGCYGDLMWFHGISWSSYVILWELSSGNLRIFEISIENHHVSRENSLFLWHPMAMFDSSFDITRGYDLHQAAATRASIKGQSQCLDWAYSFDHINEWVLTPILYIYI